MIHNDLFHLLTSSAPTIPWQFVVTFAAIYLALHVVYRGARLYAVFSPNPVHVERVERLAIGGRHHRSRMSYRGRVGFVESSQRHCVHPLLGGRPPTLRDPLGPCRSGVAQIDLGRQCSCQREPGYECGNDDLRDMQPQP